MARFSLRNTALAAAFTLSYLLGPVQAQQTFFPAAVPLAMRTPYLNSWESTTNESHPPIDWPGTWQVDGVHGFGWKGFLKVDGVTYSWLGAYDNDDIHMNITQTVVTPTRTIWTMLAGPMEFNITWFSPIEPGDWVRQSMPLSYLYIEAASLDGNSHSVQVYSDADGEWLSGDQSLKMQWKTVANSDIMFHQANLINETYFEEIQQQAQWGTMYYAMKNPGVTYKIGLDKDCRDQFVSLGQLDLAVDPDFRSISNPYTVFAIAADLGTISSTQRPVVWAIGLTRDPALSYVDLGGIQQNRSLYYQQNYTHDSSLVAEFLDDFPNARQRADQLDAKTLSDARAISNDYADLVSYVVRQVYGMTELTVSKNADGSWNTSDVMMFMKNIGGAAEKRVNAVEVLYQSFPLFMYLDAKLGAPLLEPLLRFQDSTNYNNPYAATDVGSSYPIAQGSNATHKQGVEQSANMLIMVYAHARATGDGKLAYKYYDLLSKWANFLVENTLYPTNQQSIDNGDILSNQTNLAIKGIIAVKAMSNLASDLGRADDARQYSANASQLVQQWTSQALSSNHSQLLAAYGDADSWTLGYNLFADRWLGTNLVDQSVYDMQTAFYAGEVASGRASPGLPIDSQDLAHANAAWNLFAAAIATNDSVRNRLISTVRARASSNQSAGVFPLLYNTADGTTVSGQASPGQGAMYAPLALSVAATSISVTLQDSHDGGHKSHIVGPVVGGVVGGVAVSGILSTLGMLFIRRRRNRDHDKSANIEWGDSPTTVNPFDGVDTAQYRPNEYGSSWSSPGQSSDHATTPRPFGSLATITTFPVPEASVMNLSGKELAQYRADLEASPDNGAAGSQASSIRCPNEETVTRPPTSKDLAGLRAMNAAAPSSSAASAPQTTDTNTGESPQSSSSHDAGVPVLPAVRDYDANLVRGDMEELRREIQLMRQGLEPPPYFEGTIPGGQ